MPISDLRAQVFRGAPSFRGPPAALSKQVLALCDQISPGHAPLAIRCSNVAGTRPHMCFENVRSVAAEHGGAVEYGWLIWEWKDNYLEAEHHAVWNRDGTLLDVTPQNPPRRQVLFLPEPGRTFDFRVQKRVDNRRVPLRNDAKVREYLDLSAKFVEIEEAYSVGSEVILTASVNYELDCLRRRLREIESDLALWSLNRMGRNDSCCCGSGKKFKSCCLPHRGPAVAFAAADPRISAP